MKRSREPVFWTLFGAGGMLSALVGPVLIFTTGIAIPIGFLLPQQTMDYTNMLALMRMPVGKVAALTVISSSATHVAVHPTLDIRIEATCQTSSDATSYSHLSQVRITVDGAEHFRKSWNATVPRKLS